MEIVSYPRHFSTSFDDLEITPDVRVSGTAYASQQFDACTHEPVSSMSVSSVVLIEAVKINSDDEPELIDENSCINEAKDYIDTYADDFIWEACQ